MARAGARLIAERARTAAGGARFTIAVSGGSTPWKMFSRLRDEPAPWRSTEIFQVDERVATADDPDRNLAHLHRSLGDVQAEIHPMPVEAEDLDAGAVAYGAALPDRFDLVHLGLGPDGHTASLVPGDPVLEVSDRLVALAGPYQGRRRMTLTYPALARADQLLWLVTGEEKREPLARLLAGDRTIPAGRVEAASSLVMVDRAAVP